MSATGSHELRRLTAARLATGVGGSLALCALAVIATPLFGHTRIDLVHVFGAAAGSPDRQIDRQIVLGVRLPRALLGAVCGAGLAGAGAALQAALRNPLAGPFSLGITGGGALGAALAILLRLDVRFGGSALAVAALAGCLATLLAVHRLARVGRALPPATLLLAGVTISFLASAGVLLVKYLAGPDRSYQIERWMMGDLDIASYAGVLEAALPTVLALLVLQWTARDLNALAAGEEAAASVGVDAPRVTRIAYVAASVAVAATVAVAGPIGFVGLLVPHATRALVGPDHRVLLPASALLGGTALVVCDTVGRTVLPSAEIPVGVVVALVGGPFFLYLLVRTKGRASVWG